MVGRNVTYSNKFPFITWNKSFNVHSNNVPLGVNFIMVAARLYDIKVFHSILLRSSCPFLLLQMKSSNSKGCIDCFPIPFTQSSSILHIHFVTTSGRIITWVVLSMSFHVSFALLHNTCADCRPKCRMRDIATGHLFGTCKSLTAMSSFVIIIFIALENSFRRHPSPFVYPTAEFPSFA